MLRRVRGWCPGKTPPALPNKSISQFNTVRLTFREPRTEMAFLKHIREDMPTWMFWFSTIVFFVSILGIISLDPWKGDTGSLDFLYPSAYSDFLTVYTVVAVFMLCNMVAAKVTCLMRRISFYAFELYGLVACFLLTCVVVISHPPYMAMLRGYRDVGFEDTSVLLFLAGLMLGFHMTPCLRWHMLVPLQLASVLLYWAAVQARFGAGAYTHRARYAFQLAGIVACASYSKRRNQFYERQSFLSLIAERTSRVATEFRLEQHVSARSVTRPDDGRSTASVPTTTDTGRVFRLPAEGGHAWAPLGEIGRREQWLIESRDLSWDPDHILGVGGFGIVIQGFYQGVTVAVKVAKASGRGGGRGAPQIAELCNELQILRRLRHPNCVFFFGAWIDEEHEDIALVLELVQGASLKQFVRQSPPAKDRAQVLAQVSCALLYLHGQYPKVVHSDLKDTNIFVESRNGDSVAKLLDFGLARRLTKSAPSLGGSLAWMAPEVAQARAPSTASDIFSFGRVMYYVATGSTPGHERSPAGMIVELRNGVVPPLAWPAADPFADEYRSIVERCCEVSVALRPSSSEAHEAAVQISDKHSTPAKFRHGGAGTHEGLRSDLVEVRRAARQWRPPAGKPLGQSGEPEGRRRRSPTPSDPTAVRSAPSGRRLYPGFEVTPTGTLEDAILPALMRFNFDLPPEACCEFHAAVQNLQRIVSSLAAQRCLVLGLEAVAQCGGCGAIITADDCNSSGSGRVGVQECYFCGAPIELADRAG